MIYGGRQPGQRAESCGSRRPDWPGRPAASSAGTAPSP